MTTAPFSLPRDVVPVGVTLGDEPTTGAVRLRDLEHDFRVDEIGLFEPAGSGEHLFLLVEKTGHSTTDLVETLARTYGIRSNDIGFAGRKDARGVTSQWISAPRKKIDDDGKRLEEAGRYVVKQARPHTKKLHLGVLAGNRFTLVLRSDEGMPDIDVIRARADTLAREGFPNFFGAQRFGRDGTTLDEADRFLSKGFAPRSRKERFLVSAAQSALFNRWLMERIADGLFRVALDGDVLGLFGRGSTFVCDDPATDTPRVARLELDPRGPLYGTEMRPAEREAMTRESRSLQGLGIDPEIFGRHPAWKIGERRPSIASASDLEVGASDDGVKIAFTLPKGTYATVFLREVFGRGLVDAAFPTSET
jgi:tRNA pseudouridine13 synthase